MNQKLEHTRYTKIFTLILRIRENEQQSTTDIISNLRLSYYTYRDRARIKLGLLLSRLFHPNEKEIITFLLSCYKNRKISKAQLFQDILAYFVSPKKNGYFVEFGATDGIFLSNTCLLEKRFNWQGILAEPAKSWSKKLKNNRDNCAIDYRCVWRKSGEEINFLEDALPEISGISTLIDKNRSSSNSSNYLVKTVSLIDLLDEQLAPKFIDFISIDTEGSEFEILENFDFTRYKFGLISVEHNYEIAKRDKILSLLSKNNYKRIFQDISGMDDWYVICTNEIIQESKSR